MKLLLALVLIAVAMGQHPAPRLKAIEMETSSWGRTVASWSIDAEGNGRWTVPEPGTFNAKHLVTRSFAAGTAGFRRIRVLIGAAEQRAGGQLRCTVAVTDATYGTVRWVEPGGRTATLPFYTACREASTRAIVDQLGQADRQIADWAEPGPVVETKDVP